MFVREVEAGYLQVRSDSCRRVLNVFSLSGKGGFQTRSGELTSIFRYVIRSPEATELVSGEGLHSAPVSLPGIKIPLLQAALVLRARSHFDRGYL